MEDSRNAKEHERTLRNAKESFGQGSGAISYKKHINAVHLKLKTFQCEKCQKTPKLEKETHFFQRQFLTTTILKMSW